jgi:transcriptional regulator with XRE-family HTH domain
MKKSKYTEVIRFGENVRKLRVKKGLTQEDLAELTGLQAAYIGFVERGLRSPSIRTTAKLYKALGCQPNILFKGV